MDEKQSGIAANLKPAVKLAAMTGALLHAGGASGLDHFAAMAWPATSALEIPPEGFRCPCHILYFLPRSIA
ncbi:MAG: hypothetical protein ACT6SF_11840 [Hydrogenophaga sp.]|jgi:hypothetical protein|uniref:hypothetical protein n=1 Tax=Hydrogenophaga sp. TaxID=1904254 RepID=UPI0025B9E7F4|nr:hypothetical protein [Hydrogenophaga sp.]MBW0182544.1 hypothetical protein [Hydrogenophaga sp.]